MATNKQSFNIYTIPGNYNISASKFDEFLTSFDTIDDIVEELTITQSTYHFRIHKNTIYNFFGDLDHYTNTIEHFRDLLKAFLEKYYKLSFSDYDFKYTKNTKKSGSYHYSIPKWNLTTEKLKEIMTNFNKVNKTVLNDNTEKDGNNISKTSVDTSIYSEHWFRCPNQYKPNETIKSVHEIVHGIMSDFIIDYIPDDSINITNASFTEVINNIIPVQQNNNNNNKVSIVEDELDDDLDDFTYQSSNNNRRNDEVKILSNVMSNIEIYKNLFDSCYKPIRFTNYDDWVTVGMAIKNTFKNYKDGLELFIYFSKKGSNYDGIDSVTTKYKSFTIMKNGYTARTLFKIALEDNKNKAIRIISSNKLNFAVTDICTVLMSLAGKYYFYQNNNGNYRLYCYDGSYWKTDDIPLRRYISTELYEFYKDLINNIYLNSPDYETYSKQINRLKTLAFKREIIETYKEINVNNEIVFDNKWWLFGFNNLVYDMKTCDFREYEPEDYITITTGYDWQKPTFKELVITHSLLRKIMYVPDELETFLQILATGIDGRCLEKFIIFNGSGGNGKGVVDDMMLVMLGNYGMIANNSLLFENSSMGCNPEKANIHKKRYIVFREPPARLKFQNSIIKEITGGGTFSARGLYDSNTTKDLNNTTICECNDKPAFSDEITNADVRRIIDIYFRASFTDNKDLVDENNHIYKANPEYKTPEFKHKYKFALFKILTDQHKKYLANNSILTIAPSINARTQNYLENSVDIVTWFKDEYTYDETSNEYLKVGDLYNELVNCDFFQSMKRTERDKYTKLKFFEFVRTNMFFRKYYVEYYEHSKRLLKGWYKTNNEIDM
jgi:hypothetical protein